MEGQHCCFLPNIASDTADARQKKQKTTQRSLDASLHLSRKTELLEHQMLLFVVKVFTATANKRHAKDTNGRPDIRDFELAA